MTDTGTDANFRGRTPEEMELPLDLVERIRLVCRLLALPVAERSGAPGVQLRRDDPWRPGEVADHVTVSWGVTDELMDADEFRPVDTTNPSLYDATDMLEEALVRALRLGGLDVVRAEDTREWHVRRITGPSPLD
ncbi:hypothetical protein [Kitasatospora sp. CB01950]|uniref:hypothetical protein n=1 Tax=Kitasatospora sp. CB01950 TaxID=1703930 RepID=UPI001161217E|nr:hypothetical protein [Kitasatospora sp. CB01950]